jgi:molybdate transport system substrate-binding protein
MLIAPQPGIDALVRAGKVTAANVTVLARAGISVAVRKGSPRPDISSAEAFKRALLAANSITYLNPKDGGASGIHFAKVLDRLEIADQVRAKTVLASKADAIGVMVASGQAEIGVLQFQLLFAVPGIEIVGPLPGELQNTTIFSAAVLGSAKEAEASKALATFLRAPEAAVVFKAMGLEPASI